MRISDWSSDVCSSDLSPKSRWRRSTKDHGNMRGIQVLLAMRDLAISEEQQEVIVAGICVAVGKRHIPLGGQADAIGLAGYIVETKTDGAGSVGKQLFEIGEPRLRSEEHTSELQSLMRISYAVFCL